MKTTLVQFIVIGLGALMVGFSANALRGNAALQLSKNYFDSGTDIIAAAKAKALASSARGTGDSDSTTTMELDSTPNALSISAAPDAIDAHSESGGGHLEHDLQVITFQDIHAMLEDPMTQAGLNVIVDARNEQAFEDGHLPGALLCNPYAVADYIDRDVGGQTMLDAALAAEKVIAYCGGGDCADSIYMCRELIELGVPYSSIFLYEGGWNDWTANGGEIEKGVD